MLTYEATNAPKTAQKTSTYTCRFFAKNWVIWEAKSCDNSHKIGTRDQGIGVSYPVAQPGREEAMKTSERNSFASGPGSYEETLRLIARISAPEGLEERVQEGLRAATGTASGRARILRWPVALRLENVWMQNLARTAAAAAIVAVVVGGGWSVCSRFQPTQPSSAIAVPQRGAGQTGQPGQPGQGGFSSAGAMRTPQTLNGPIVAAPAVLGWATGNMAANAHAKTRARQVKPVPTKNPIAPNPR
jgi:hypothetical protein